MYTTLSVCCRCAGQARRHALSMASLSDTGCRCLSPTASQPTFVSMSRWFSSARSCTLITLCTMGMSRPLMLNTTTSPAWDHTRQQRVCVACRTPASQLHAWHEGLHTPHTARLLPGCSSSLLAPLLVLVAVVQLRRHHRTCAHWRCAHVEEQNVASLESRLHAATEHYHYLHTSDVTISEGRSLCVP